MFENKNSKLITFLKNFLKKFRPKFSIHYVAYTVFAFIIVFSLVHLVSAVTPNPGHPWLEIGDGVFSVTNNQTAARTYTFPDANATILTTNAAVTVAQGGTGVATLASNGVLYGNGTGAVLALAVNAGATQCLTQASSLAPAWGACSGSGGTAWSGITAPTANLSLAHGAFTTNFSFDSLTTANAFSLNSTSLSSGALLDLTSSGTAALTNQKGLNISLTGANATGAQTTYGAYISNTHAGTTSTNVGLYATATGGTTANYAAIFDQGSVGIGTTTPTSKLDITTNALGGTQSTTTSGLSLNNTTAAALGAQQISPALRWRGQGWKTDVTAASQSVDFRAFVTPVEGTANPTGYLGFGSSINGAAFTDGQMVLTSAGNVGIGDTTPLAALTVGSGDLFQVNSSGAIAAVTGYIQGSGTMSLTSANTTQATTSSIFALNGNSLTTGTGAYIASSSLTSGSLLDLSSSGTAALTNQKGLNISLTGANATGAQTTYGAYLANTHSGTTSTNVGLYATATGGTTANYAAIFAAGNVGIGTTAPGTELEVVGDITSKGTKWTDRNVTSAKSWRSVTYGNGLFVAVNSDTIATAAVMTSPDGINWTDRNVTSAKGWTSVTYGNGLFVAVNVDGLATAAVMTSPDGINWTDRNVTSAKGWTSVTYGNGLFVAVNNSGLATAAVMTSPDGINWTDRNVTSAKSWTSVTYGNGLFVAVNNSGLATAAVMTSPNGITWTDRNVTSAKGWTSVTYGNGLFVAVNADASASAAVMTSPDGITWTDRNVTSAKGWRSVTYGNGLFVAVNDSNSATAAVMTSPDGITWTDRNVTSAKAWRSVTYGNGLFVAVNGNFSATAAVMTSGKSENNFIQTSSGSVGNLFQGGLSIFGNVGIGTTSPLANLSITQTATATGALKGIIYTGAVNTNQTLSTEIPSLTLTTAGREWATGALTTQREVLITQPTYSFVGASTITDAATFAIAGAPIKSTNATITNTHGLLIQAGAVSTATNSYGLTVNAQTGATNNYAAAFLGGNVGIGDTSPLSPLTVGANDAFQVSSTGAITAATGVTTSGTLSSTGLGIFSGNGAAFDTWLGSSTITGDSVRISPTAHTLNTNGNFISAAFVPGAFTEASSGVHPLIALVGLKSPTITDGTATTTNAATLYIEGAAIGTATVTNNYALWSDSGDNRFDGNIIGNSTLSLTSANTTQATTSSIFALNGNSLTTGTGAYLASSSLTSGALLDLSSNGTAALNNQKGLNISLAGANTNTFVSSYGVYSSNAHTGTFPSNYGGYFSATGTGGNSTNIGLYATASGGTNNYAAIFNGGIVGIGTTAPGTELEVVGDITSKGTKWTDRNVTSAKAWVDVTYGNGLFVAVNNSNSATAAVMTSPDGITWTDRNVTSAKAWVDVTYGNGLFVAINNSGSATAAVMTSPDGITWTDRNVTSAKFWSGVTYGNGLFVAVNNDLSATAAVMTSPDGITWTNRNVTSAKQWSSVTYGNGLFVAVNSDSSATTAVMTSPDGIIWTDRNVTSAKSWYGVTYGNGLFVAVNNSGSATAAVMTSPDGIIWTDRNVTSAKAWLDVTYGNGLFVAVNNSNSATAAVMTSPDGIIWTDRNVTSAKTWYGVTYGNGSFVAVNQNSSATAAVMTSGKSENNFIQTSAGTIGNLFQGGLSIFGNVGIGTSSPLANLAITQTATATGALKGIIYTGAVNTNQTLSTEIPSLTLTTAGREWATGALTTQREVLITQPTYSFVGASTITDAATFAIAGAPIKSTNATITNTHGLLIQAGAVSTATNSYGLTVNAQTGATNNYAAAFLGGKVGIGTTAPVGTLHLYDTVGAGATPSLIMGGADAGDTDYWLARVANNDSTSNDPFQIGFGNVPGTTPALTLKETGNLGIGTITPLEKLQVAGNILIGAQTDATASSFTSINSAAGTFGAQTLVDKVTSSVIFKGKLFVATAETNAAGVYRYDGGTTWTLVTNAAGKAVVGDAVDADTFIMTVYNGALYIANQTGAATGAIYSSTTADTTADSFTMLNATRGTSGMSQTTITGYTDMAVWNGRLYVATQRTDTAEIGFWAGGTTFTQVTATDGKAVAETAIDKDGFLLTSYNGMLIAGGITGSTTASVAAYQGNGTTWTLLNSATGGGTLGAETAMIDITSMAVYNGSLYIAASKANAAAIYALRITTPVANVVANFVRVNTTVGKLIVGDAATIDGFTLRTYNGRLYAGSVTAAAEDTAALYEYTSLGSGAIDWTLINTTRGTFGSETLTNAISMMQDYNGILYIGTDEGTNGKAAVYTWTKNSQNSFGLKFDSGSNNYGAISFVGDQQASDNAGRYGTFRITNPVSLTSGSFDYAEDYPTYDTTLLPGDLVSIDPKNNDFIKKADGTTPVIGIYSTNPGLRLQKPQDTTDTGETWVPIALVGRVPLKVSTENGVIKNGDSLTLSTKLPGVAMKATKAGTIIARALSSYNGEGVGTVSAFIDNSYSQGASFNTILKPVESLDEEGAIILTQPTYSARALLSQFIAESKVLSQQTLFSDISADRVAVGLEIVTPNLYSNKIATNYITSSTGKNIALVLDPEGKFILGGETVTTVTNADGTETSTTALTPVITFDSLGNASFAGTLSAKEIKVGDVAGISAITEQINQLAEGQQVFTLTASALTALSDSLTVAKADIAKIKEEMNLATTSNTATFAGLQTDITDKDDRLKALEALLARDENNNLNTLTINTMTISGDGTFEGKAQFNGLSFFSNTTTFASGVIFNGETEFTAPPLFNKDTAGFALVKKGDKKVTVVFDKEYIATPVVNTSMTFEKEDKVTDTEATALFAQDVRFVVVEKDQKGFIILLNKGAPRNIRFSWNALHVRDPKIIESIFEGLTIEPSPTTQVKTPEQPATPESIKVAPKEAPPSTATPSSPEGTVPPVTTAPLPVVAPSTPSTPSTPSLPSTDSKEVTPTPPSLPVTSAPAAPVESVAPPATL